MVRLLVSSGFLRQIHAWEQQALPRLLVISLLCCHRLLVRQEGYPSFHWHC